VAVLLESGMVFASAFAHEMRAWMISPAFSKMTVFERAAIGCWVLLSSGKSGLGRRR